MGLVPFRAGAHAAAADGLRRALGVLWLADALVKILLPFGDRPIEQSYEQTMAAEADTAAEAGVMGQRSRTGWLALWLGAAFFTALPQNGGADRPSMLTVSQPGAPGLLQTMDTAELRCLTPRRGDCRLARPQLRSCRMRDPRVPARLLAGLAAVALAAGCAGRAADAGAGTGTGGQSAGTTVFPAGQRPAAPQVSGASLTGAPLRLRAYRGRVVVLNFWASWCDPCQAEGPALARLWRGYQPRGIQFIGVDVSDGRAQAQAFERRFGIGYPSLYDPSAGVELAFGRVIPPALPDTLVIDRNGDIEARIIGQVTFAGLQRLLGQSR